MYSAPIAAGFSSFCPISARIATDLPGFVQPARVTSRHAFAKILICQCLAGESGGPVSMQIPGIH